MHTKDLGKIGEAAVIQQCLSLGLEVFIDFGDNSKVDLIVNSPTGLHKVQVKCYTPKDGKIILELYKSGPSYRYRYEPEDIDWFAVVNSKNTTKIAWVNVKEICEKFNKQCSLRIDPPKNNQVKGVTWFKDFQINPFGPVAQ